MDFLSFGDTRRVAQIFNVSERRFRQWIILLGYVGTGIGFIGMVFIIVILVKNVYDLIEKHKIDEAVLVGRYKKN